MSYWLFLDDTRDPPAGWGRDRQRIIVRSYVEFIGVLTEFGCPQVISFDHDLGPTDNGEKNGMDCAKFFVEWILDDRSRMRDDFTFAVHSMNPAGARNIIGLMDGFRKAFAKGEYGTARRLVK